MCRRRTCWNNLSLIVLGESLDPAQIVRAVDCLQLSLSVQVGPAFALAHKFVNSFASVDMSLFVYLKM